MVTLLEDCVWELSFRLLVLIYMCLPLLFELVSSVAMVPMMSPVMTSPSESYDTLVPVSMVESSLSVASGVARAAYLLREVDAVIYLPADFYTLVAELTSSEGWE